MLQTASKLEVRPCADFWDKPSIASLSFSSKESFCDSSVSSVATPKIINDTKLI